MEQNLPSSYSSAQWIQLADALAQMRDSLVKVSLVLNDLVAETPSIERDAILSEVESFLSRIRET